MRRFLWRLALCLGFGVAGAVVARLLGDTVLTVVRILLGRSDPMGQGLLLVYVLIPGGFVLGVLLAAYLLWKGQPDSDPGSYSDRDPRD
jgi:hypothetical protein